MYFSSIEMQENIIATERRGTLLRQRENIFCTDLSAGKEHIYIYIFIQYNSHIFNKTQDIQYYKHKTLRWCIFTVEINLVRKLRSFHQ